MTNTLQFTWLNTYKKIISFLSTKREKQESLIEILRLLGVDALNDIDESDTQFPMNEIDPFTFLAYLNKYGDKNRLDLIQRLSNHLKFDENITDVSGLPTSNAQKVWLFVYKKERVNNEINRLWDFFFDVLDGNINNENFKDILNIKNVGKTKLTEVLFYVNPEKYFPINGPVKPYLEKVLNINTNFNTFDEYNQVLEKVQSKTNESFYKISYDAWLWGQENNKVNYWVFQGNPSVFDIERSLREKILDNWTVTAHKDKIKEGDKVILWVTGNKSGCYALAEVTSKPYDYKPSSDEHLWKKESKATSKADITIEYSFVDNPILKSDLTKHKVFDKFKGGSQGSNFSSTKKEYEVLKSMRINKATSLLVPLFKEIGKENIFDLTQTIDTVINTLALEQGDERFFFNLPKSKNKLGFSIGQCYIAVLDKRKFGWNKGYIDKQKEPDKDTWFYFLEDNQNYKEQLDNIITNAKSELERTSKTGYSKSNSKEFEKYIFDKDFRNEVLMEAFGVIENITSEKTDKKVEINYPLNSILYGPPGTGKTYSTISKAASIIAGYEITDYMEAKKIFNEHRGNQIEFITFHQNYSYEDFIQGLRPDTDKGDQLSFEKKDGIFKAIADKALSNLKDAKEFKVSKKPYEEVFQEFFQPLLEGEVEEIEIQMKKVSYFITEIGNKSIGFRKASGGTAHTLSIESLRKMYSAESTMGIQGLSTYYTPLLEELLKIGKSGVQEKVEKKNYVIIIDEINRANISRVFGELITLIEPDKRYGGDLALTTTLPSGDEFTVPSNLYIIGTMNTADKSIALLDIALRRRFEFESLYPQYDLEGMHYAEILQKINDKIISMKGHDFQIGHSYFMDKNFDLFKTINNKVIPLLLEYFLNDEKDVKSILGYAGFKVDKTSWPLKVEGFND
ncbi:AAA family ATPase [Flammeovirga kamogawensis]|uniref:EVE domain-containing protein n=1 Tax=Flammeovirga kamogawensis TaxID=373891 RepID=A0ABX8H1J7_9BACT|nr:AAA family ATPase [Flammeovirga kamogawensis]MBB6462390.1 hypothetical protein [Flammeovirga kamogawensis]QWG09503.1 EVE domain-containing protein [Flammeovirga kamogawensis]TRX65019.1 EVE domain-containing protein [Flammeovirga kamogawensis]